MSNIPNRAAELKAIAADYAKRNGGDALAEILSAKGFGSLEEVPPSGQPPVMAAILAADNAKTRVLMKSRRAGNRLATVGRAAWAKRNKTAAKK